MSVNDNGKVRQYEYDRRGYPTRTKYADGKTEIRVPDNTGNLYETLNRSDRKYGRGGQLIKTARWEYRFDDVGNLVRKKDRHVATWRYEWNDARMLSRVKRPDSGEITFRYDALGRRIEKRFNRAITQWVWDGNVPLHEWKEIHKLDYEPDRGHFTDIQRQPLITWVYEDSSFVPAAKITEAQTFSIVSNYMGTPEAMYDDGGQKVWSCELNSYGNVRDYQGLSKTDCPFRYQGQYEDAETGLYYNRFRYHSPEEGVYISQDPIRLNGGVNLYSYVYDTNGWIDIIGLAHTMTGFVFRNNVKLENVGGTYTSGGGTPGWGQISHTEQKFLRDIKPTTQPGGHIVMSGVLDPCAQGKGCQPAIRDQVAQTGVNAEYFASDSKIKYTWEKIGENKVLQTKYDGKTKTTTQYVYDTETKRRKKVKLCNG